MAKQVLIFLGIKTVNFCQQVLKPLGSYTRVFTVASLILCEHIPSERLGHITAFQMFLNLPSSRPQDYLSIPKGVTLFIKFRKEEQIKKDEQLARAYQEQLDISTPPDTIGSELSQTLENTDRGSEQARRGQVRISKTTYSWMAVLCFRRFYSLWLVDKTRATFYVDCFIFWLSPCAVCVCFLVTVNTLVLVWNPVNSPTTKLKSSYLGIHPKTRNLR